MKVKNRGKSKDHFIVGRGSLASPARPSDKSESEAIRMVRNSGCVKLGL
jgi:hypothetical protein